MLGIVLVICQSFGASCDDLSQVLSIALVICHFLLGIALKISRNF